MLLVEPTQLEARSRRGYAAPELGDVLESRLKFCAEQDRLIVEMVYQHNLSCRQIARLQKIAAGSVSRRLRRIIRRLHDPLIIALTDSTCTLPPEHRAVGIAYFLQDQSLTRLMRQGQRSRREVEAMIEFIRGWFRGIGGKA